MKAKTCARCGRILHKRIEWQWVVMRKYGKIVRLPMCRDDRSCYIHHQQTSRMKRCREHARRFVM